MKIAGRLYPESQLIAGRLALVSIALLIFLHQKLFSLASTVASLAVML